MSCQLNATIRTENKAFCAWISVVSAPYNLFQQTGSANRSVCFSIPEQGQIWKSLGTRGRHEAEKLAQRFYYESLLKAENGLNVREKPILRIIENYIAHMEAPIAQARLPQNAATQNTAILTRYADGFFGAHKPNFISSKSVDAYLSWRSDYWSTGSGKDVSFITYARNGKTITSPITDKKRVRPTPTTLNREHTALSGFSSSVLIRSASKPSLKSEQPKWVTQRVRVSHVRNTNVLGSTPSHNSQRTIWILLWVTIVLCSVATSRSLLWQAWDPQKWKTWSGVTF